MTEQEYIYVRDLSNVLAADRLLRDLNPDFNGIPKNEYHDVMRKLVKWRELLFDSIETTDPIT